MKLRLYLLVLIASLGLFGGVAHAAGAPTAAAEQRRCQALAGDRFNLIPSAPTEIIRTTFHAATAQRRAFCDIEGYVNPNDQFGLWLPTDWNGKYIVRGCGGSCGIVAMEVACAAHLRDGYACLQTDMGHHSTQLDNLWVIDNLMGQIDFGYRSTHVTAVAGKAILKDYYETDPTKSYFFACSTGGRQAMIEAQRFPDDFDGIIAIAPVSMASFNGGKPLSPARRTSTGAPTARPSCPTARSPCCTGRSWPCATPWTG